MPTKAAQDKLNKPLAFEVIEPRGNHVICARGVWESHIVPQHPEMRQRIDEVRAALEDPDSIRQSTVRPDAQVYEWIAPDSAQIRVAVTFDDVSLIDSGHTIAKVNTAFPVDPVLYDRPNVGRYLYTRASASNQTKQESDE